MRQYSYQITHRTTGRIDQARATARTQDIARDQIILAYGRHFIVARLPAQDAAPHRIAGEIDCSRFPSADVAWLADQAAIIDLA